ncbi:CLUMA_CG000355, isoform A [Clunio marinus]|uniref:CLUMA_CG000355, isoform A n=1 Tax=Clunio marinus TaxID=568069 RepID=A0A1J1HEZ4_9DIPT|nr:CLUMA_CG000355, isoform A [Clunio marinus]
MEVVIAHRKEFLAIRLLMLKLFDKKIFLWTLRRLKKEKSEETLEDFSIRMSPRLLGSWLLRRHELSETVHLLFIKGSRQKKMKFHRKAGSLERIWAKCFDLPTSLSSSMSFPSLFDINFCSLWILSLTFWKLK